MRVPFIERAIAGIALAILTPVLILVAVAVRLDSRGPAFHRAIRVGQGGRPFTLFKLRSMRMSDDAVRITIAGDRRVTRIGRVLRSAKIDEIPQLLNIARGEMRFVGPRPEDAAYVDLTDAEQRALVAVPPGVTGAASLEFRDEEAVLARRIAGGATADDAYAEVQATKRRLDLGYEVDRTWRSDVALVGATIGVVLGRNRHRSAPATGVSADELRALDSAYHGYRGDYAERWSAANQGNVEIVREREAAARHELADVPAEAVVLDIGAGSAGSFPGVVSHGMRVRLDILEWRLHRPDPDPHTATESDNESADDAEREAGVDVAVCGDGSALPFAADSVDVVFLSTVLSSVDPTIGAAILSEAQRVVRRGGRIVVYDFRVPNPRNAATRPIRRRWVVSHLGLCESSAQSLTVVPQLARRLGRRTPPLYRLLASMPLTRTHNLVVARRVT